MENEDGVLLGNKITNERNRKKARHCTLHRYCTRMWALLWNADERTSKKEIMIQRKGQGKGDTSNFATNFFFKSSEEGKMHQ